MLTDSALNELFETVEDVPPFRRIDFKSSQEEDRTTIRYQHDKNCYFIVLNDHERPVTGVRVAAVPGTWLKESEHSCDTFRGLTHEFGNWLNRILKEIRAKPVNRMVFEQQEQLRKLAEEMSQKWNIEDEKAQFTPEEVSEIVKRLDQIEQQFSEHIRGTAEGEVDIDEKIEALEGEIAFLKDTLHTMNREGWFSTFASRLLTWANEPGNQQLLNRELNCFFQAVIQVWTLIWNPSFAYELHSSILAAVSRANAPKTHGLPKASLACSKQ